MQWEMLAEQCEEGPCPAIHRTAQERIVAQGTLIERDMIPADIEVPDHEALVEITPQVVLEAARRLVIAPAEFDRLFDGFRHTVFRLETLQQYLVEGDRFQSWIEGRPVPERSPRTSPWLRRIQQTTAEGKRWQRVHVVDLPLSPYLRYELAAYEESAAVGEEVRIVERSAPSALADLRQDFWLFDGDQAAAAQAVLMYYDTDGHWLGAEATRHPDRVAACRQQRDLALRGALRLAEFLAKVS